MADRCFLVLFIYRKEIPILIRSIKKVGLGNFFIELFEAKQYSPDWAEGAADARHDAVLINSSAGQTFSALVSDNTRADFAIVDLGDGDQWLASRLYIFAILLERVKGLKAFVFLEGSKDSRKHYIGWATPTSIHWALAREFPWFEKAYADAYMQVTTKLYIDGNLRFTVGGNLINAQDSASAPPVIDVLKEFLKWIQLTPPVQPADGDKEWVKLKSSEAYEHTPWLTGSGIEEILGDELQNERIQSDIYQGKNTVEQLSIMAGFSKRYVALIGENQRFEKLVDRYEVLESAVRRMAKTDPQ